VSGHRQAKSKAMALINCSECKKEVSDKAASCPHCGAPIFIARESKAAGALLTTVQETSKKLKAHKVIASLMFWFGIGWVIVDTNAIVRPGESIAAPAMTSIGLLWYIVTRFRIWWHHK